MLRDKVVQVVMITTPPESHFKLAIAALSADKHIIVEKLFTAVFFTSRSLDFAGKRPKAAPNCLPKRTPGLRLLDSKAHEGGRRLVRIVEFESYFDHFRPTLATSTWNSRTPAQEIGLFTIWGLISMTESEISTGSQPELQSLSSRRERQQRIRRRLKTHSRYFCTTKIAW
ncbi:hypothetical protein GQ53DRAFT_885087 [Thozetella sp. PMI_491]|nr:hypothetical protein GQ53DRAFT_885087 [Thozetella sp. PMI_491]